MTIDKRKTLCSSKEIYTSYYISEFAISSSKIGGVAQLKNLEGFQVKNPNPFANYPYIKIQDQVIIVQPRGQSLKPQDDPLKGIVYWKKKMGGYHWFGTLRV